CVAAVERREALVACAVVSRSVAIHAGQSHSLADHVAAGGSPGRDVRADAADAQLGVRSRQTLFTFSARRHGAEPCLRALNVNRAFPRSLRKSVADTSTGTPARTGGRSTCIRASVPTADRRRRTHRWPGRAMCGWPSRA